MPSWSSIQKLPCRLMHHRITDYYCLFLCVVESEWGCLAIQETEERWSWNISCYYQKKYPMIMVIRVRHTSCCSPSTPGNIGSQELSRSANFNACLGHALESCLLWSLPGNRPLRLRNHHTKQPNQTCISTIWYKAGWWVHVNCRHRYTLQIPSFSPSL